MDGIEKYWRCYDIRSIPSICTGRTIETATGDTEASRRENKGDV
jgi:hypothetical protein